MAVPLARLDTAGWVISPSEIVATLFEYYRRSEKSQSNNFRGVASLVYTLARTTNDWGEIENDVAKDLNRLFEPYFDTVNINCNVVMDPIYDVDNPKYSLNVTGTVTLKGNTLNIGKLVTVENNIVVGFEDVS